MFKDLFSGHAQDYAKFRPHYPRDLFHYLSGLTQHHDVVWDCGTGNGQSAVGLTEFYQKIYATDPSAKQLASAPRHEKITYLQASAEDSGLPDHCADLVTVAQAFHWFKFEDFYREVKRVAKPGGILAIWTYNLAHVTSAIDAVVQRLYGDILRDDWDPERHYVEEGYKSIIFPFLEITAPSFTMQMQWNVEHFLGYLETWSATQKYLRRTNTDPVGIIKDDLLQAWGKEVREVRWPLVVRVMTI